MCLHARAEGEGEGGAPVARGCDRFSWPDKQIPGRIIFTELTRDLTPGGGGSSVTAQLLHQSRILVSRENVGGPGGLGLVTGSELVFIIILVSRPDANIAECNLRHLGGL